LDLLRTFADCSLPALPSSWIEAIGQSIASENPAIRREAVRTAAIWQVPELDEALAQVAESDDEPAELRSEALGAVISRRSKLASGVFEVLLEQLTSGDPLARLQAAELAGRALLTAEQLKRLLAVAREDPLISPSVLLPAVLKADHRDATDVSFQYIMHSLQQGWRPPTGQLRAILESLSAGQCSALHLLAQLERSEQELHGELEKYEPLLAGGDPDRGRAVFFGSKVACGSCHRIGSEGGSVGPDLTRIGTVRSGRDLVESIVFPSSTFAQGYESFLVTTSSGRTTTGTIAQQDGEVLVLRDSSGAMHRIVKGDVEVPNGLARAMSREEFQDLLAFLQTLK
jgi:putative heme-binding domain-containing protein